MWPTLGSKKDSMHLQCVVSPYGLHWDKHTEWWCRWWLVKTCPGFSSILLRYQNTSTRMNTDSHKERAVHSEKCWVEMWGGGGYFPLQLAQDAGSSMSYMWIQGISETFHHRPFVSQPCRTLGPSRGSWRWKDFQYSVRSSRLQHICVFSHQCEIVQYDGCLMLKQDWYYDLGRIFSYKCFKTFIPSSSYLQSI